MDVNSMNNNNDVNNIKGTNSVLPSFFIFIWVFFLIWALIGIIGFMYSIYCFGKSGETLEKIVGLLLSIFFGPFFFAYLYFNKGYCRDKNNNK